MLEEAHKGLEVMSTAANAVKDEQWGEAERALMEVQEIIGRLLREVADKAREKMLAPVPDRRGPRLAGHPDRPATRFRECTSGLPQLANGASLFGSTFHPSCLTHRRGKADSSSY